MENTGSHRPKTGLFKWSRTVPSSYPKSKGKHYAEWKAEQEGRPTIRGQIKDELDEIIKASYTYKDFWRILKQRGYEVKCDVKYVALKPAYSQRYIRLKSLGENYSEESIQRRIAMARNGTIIMAENLIGDILTEVQNGMDMLMQEQNQAAFSLMLG